MSDVIAVATFIAWVAAIPWLYARKADWWRGGRPVTQLWFVNAVTRGRLAYLPVLGVMLLLVIIASRVKHQDLLSWAIMVLAVGLFISVVFFNRPRFLLPPGYLKVYAPNARKRVDH